MVLAAVVTVVVMIVVVDVVVFVVTVVVMIVVVVVVAVIPFCRRSCLGGKCCGRDNGCTCTVFWLLLCLSFLLMCKSIKLHIRKTAESPDTKTCDFGCSLNLDFRNPENHKVS